MHCDWLNVISCNYWLAGLLMSPSSSVEWCMVLFQYAAFDSWRLYMFKSNLNDIFSSSNWTYIQTLKAHWLQELFCTQWSTVGTSLCGVEAISHAGNPWSGLSHTFAENKHNSLIHFRCYWSFIKLLPSCVTAVTRQGLLSRGLCGDCRDDSHNDCIRGDGAGEAPTTLSMMMMTMNTVVLMT